MRFRCELEKGVSLKYGEIANSDWGFHHLGAGSRCSDEGLDTADG